MKDENVRKEWLYKQKNTYYTLKLTPLSVKTSTFRHVKYSFELKVSLLKVSLLDEIPVSNSSSNYTMVITFLQKY
jgi:hypothetical protein